jgi:Ni/Fe-hydrogenase subunit HybB-like protein
MWQVNSVLFEVGMCVMIYLTVLYIEFLPIVVVRFAGRVNWPTPLRWANGLTESFLSIANKTLGRFLFVFVIMGVVLSCLHQSSLGTLMVIAKDKMHPLWWSPMSPLMFLLSAMAVGFPMVIVESISASRSFKLKPEKSVLRSLAGYTPILLAVYLVVKIVDLTLRGAWPYLLEGSGRSFMFIIEIAGGVIAPMVMLLMPRVRNSINGLFTAALMVVLGVVLNRINVFLVAYQPLYPTKTYFPSFMEIGVTVGLASVLILAYRWFVMTFPVITGEPEIVIKPTPATTVNKPELVGVSR